MPVRYVYMCIYINTYLNVSVIDFSNATVYLTCLFHVRLPRQTIIWQQAILVISCQTRFQLKGGQFIRLSVTMVLSGPGFRLHRCY